MSRPKVTIHNHRHRTSDGVTVFAYFKGRPGDQKDEAVRRAFGRYYSGAGGAIGSSMRDASGDVPEAQVAEVVAKLKGLGGVKTEVFR
jgi:hypothetical protein